MTALDFYSPSDKSRSFFASIITYYELKARKFEVGNGVQFDIYMHAVDNLLCQPEDKPTLGLLHVSL